MVSSYVTKDNLNDKVFRQKPKIEDLKVNFENVSVENESLKNGKICTEQGKLELSIFPKK